MGRCRVFCLRPAIETTTRPGLCRAIPTTTSRFDRFFFLPSLSLLPDWVVLSFPCWTARRLAVSSREGTTRAAKNRARPQLGCSLTRTKRCGGRFGKKRASSAGFGRACGDARSGPTVPFGQLPSTMWKLPRTQASGVAAAASQRRRPAMSQAFTRHLGIRPRDCSVPWRPAFEASFEASKSGTRIAYPWAMAH